MAEILGVPILGPSREMATEKIVEWALGGTKSYVCAANVHMMMEAYDSAKFREVLSHSSLLVCDGWPLAVAARLKGTDAAHVRGQDLMLSVVQAAAEKRLPIALLGGDVPTLELLARRFERAYPRIRVAASISPPFKALTKSEDQEIVDELSQSGARIIFVGLGCPKQEWWMANHYRQLDAVLIGVGAAFDFVAGTKPSAPTWMQTSGLEWLYRLSREPRRLWARYFRHNPRFVFVVLYDLLRWRGRS